MNNLHYDLIKEALLTLQKDRYRHGSDIIDNLIVETFILIDLEQQSRQEEFKKQPEKDSELI